jgi:hypothetical protein
MNLIYNVNFLGVRSDKLPIYKTFCCRGITDQSLASLDENQDVGENSTDIGKRCVQFQ